jgi:tetratricopeptide (TPR) repeat protein
VDDGIASFEAALKINPDFAPSLGNLAGLLQEQERLDEAVAINKRALDLDPSRTELRTNLAVILLKKGDAQGALEICESCLAEGQQWVRAQALKAVALAELGEDDAAKALLDLEGLIRADGVRAPAPYDDLATFNQALAEHVASHPSLVRSPPGHTQRSGWHSGELSGDEAAPISALKALLTEPHPGFLGGQTDGLQLEDLGPRHGQSGSPTPASPFRGLAQWALSCCIAAGDR